MFKKNFFRKLMALAAVFAFILVAAPAFAAYSHYQIYVYQDTGFATAAGGYTQLTSDVRYIVFDGATKTKSTIYSDSAGSARTNPVEATTFAADDKIDFYIDSTTTSVDIAIMHLNGYALWLTGVTTSTRTAILDERPGILHHGFADWDATLASQNGLTGGATDYWTFESDILMMPWVATEVITATSVSDMQLFGQLAGTAGALFNYHPTDGAKVVTFTSTYYGVTDSQTIGSVFATEPCSADVRTYSDPGKAYLISTGQTMTFSGASLLEEGAVTEDAGADSTVGWGFFHFWFVRLR